MRQADIQTALQDAIRLAQSGQRTKARRLLEQVVRADPRQALAWMWLATVSTNRDERVGFLERALALNPDNPTAQEAYAQLTGRKFIPPPAAPAAAALGDRTVLLRGGAIIIVMLVFLGVAVLVIANQFGSSDREVRRPVSVPRRTVAPSAPQVLVTPSPTLTPYPTYTPGPSPTSIWSVPLPTWTEVATETPAPTQTSGPSLTPFPTSETFIGSYALSATAAFVQTSDAGPATVEAVRTQAAITPTRTLTADLQTAAAATPVPADE